MSRAPPTHDHHYNKAVSSFLNATGRLCTQKGGCVGTASPTPRSEPERNPWFILKPRTPFTGLRSIDNLHKVYGELTELECVPVRLSSGGTCNYGRGTIRTTLWKQVMKNAAPHLFLFTISLLLVTSIIQAIQRLQGQHYSTMITSARSMNVIVSLGRDAWSTFSSSK